MIRRPPRSTLDRSSAASDVYKRQSYAVVAADLLEVKRGGQLDIVDQIDFEKVPWFRAVSYTHLRAHETVLDLVCRLLLEKKKKKLPYNNYHSFTISHCTRVKTSSLHVVEK
mgnify:CR=1 FL=1